MTVQHISRSLWKDDREATREIRDSYMDKVEAWKKNEKCPSLSHPFINCSVFNLDRQSGCEISKSLWTL